MTDLDFYYGPHKIETTLDLTEWMNVELDGVMATNVVDFEPQQPTYNVEVTFTDHTNWTAICEFDPVVKRYKFVDLVK